jgi:hypothetical protein
MGSCAAIPGPAAGCRGRGPRYTYKARPPCPGGMVRSHPGLAALGNRYKAQAATRNERIEGIILSSIQILSISQRLSKHSSVERGRHFGYSFFKH